MNILSKYLSSIILLIVLTANADFNDDLFVIDSKSEQYNLFIESNKNIEESKDKSKENNNANLLFDAETSIQKISNNPELGAYIQYHRNCEMQFARANFINIHKEKFVKNRKLAKSEWNKFLNEKLENEMATKYRDITSLTINTFAKKIKECQKRIISVNEQLSEFEKKYRQQNPKFKSLNLDFKSNKKSRLSEKGTTDNSEAEHIDLTLQKQTELKKIGAFKTIKKNIIYLKINDKIDNIETLKSFWKRIKDDLYICNTQIKDPIKCLCKHRTSYNELERLISDTLEINPEYESTIFYQLDDEGNKSNRFGIDILKIQLGQFKNYCGSDQNIKLG